MAENKPTPKRWGDRKDAKLIRGEDALHFIMGVVYPSRPDNEAYISERIDLTAINEYLEKKNAGDVDFKYTFFHLIVTALVKVATLRPKLNRFYVNGNYYQRNKVTTAFVVKKEFSDSSEEKMAFLEAKPEDNVDTIHNIIRDIVRSTRSGKQNSTDDSMDLFNRMPRFLAKAILHFLMFLDRHGWVPDSLIADDPNYSTVFISNLGSIKLKCGYHHLSTWGTASIFVIIGEKKWTPLYDKNGLVKMYESLDLGLTVDERIADGYYYMRSIKLLKYLLEHPEELEKPLSEEVAYE
ncbi:MAG: 2-oxo acid dehydrogenase subunit E2 [Oscillospiraceae bacterium]|nr:2-oxo acid dehydrogenase subunit E2 [Oscillospiraceae bacterium]